MTSNDVRTADTASDWLIVNMGMVIEDVTWPHRYE